MPRIYSTASNPYDLCRSCFPKTEEKARSMEIFNDGEGPDDRGDCFSYDEMHPPYEDDPYECDFCGCELTKRDN